MPFRPRFQKKKHAQRSGSIDVPCPQLFGAIYSANLVN